VADTTVVLFNRDLRLRDHPALTAAGRESRRVVPLFVLDDRILSGPYSSANRGAFLIDALTDLRRSLRALGGDLVVRRGSVVTETMQVVHETDADALFVSADVSRYAVCREEALNRACARQRVAFRRFPGVTVVPPDALRPAGGDHYRVFTPYWRVWDAAIWRPVERTPRQLASVPALAVGRLPSTAELTPGELSPRLPSGGESAARRALNAAARRARSPDLNLDDLAADHTSRLSPYLHFGCISPLVVAERLRETSPDQVRQLAWRDFFCQVTLSFPDIADRDYRPREIRWRQDDHALEAWRRGRTGVPIVDAGMRQLLSEGWMHNRARLITASFLTKRLRVDWRLGAAHFFRWLIDGDVANNGANWQWVAGTGNDTRPNRVLNPLRQAGRFDPEGHYVRRYVPELAQVDGPDVHRPWRLDPCVRDKLDYPPPLVDVDVSKRAKPGKR
jgi:deoxyribodipyrimidine photo-lyase